MKLPSLSRNELLPDVADPNEVLSTLMVFNVSNSLNSSFSNFDTAILSFKFRKYENSLYDDHYTNGNSEEREIHVENLSESIELQIPRIPKIAEFVSFLSDFQQALINDPCS